MSTDTTPNTPPPKKYEWDDRYDFTRDHIGYGERSFDPQWPNGAKIAVSFVINYEEGAERTVLNNDLTAEIHLAEGSAAGLRTQERAVNIESNYNYGSRSGVWRMFRLFNKHGMKYTLYAVAMAIELNPEVAASSVREGHDVASHGYRWVDYHDMPPEQEKECICKAVESLTLTCGSPPKGWYYGRLSPRSRALVWEVYHEMGIPLLWESDSYEDDLPYWVDVPGEKESEKPEGMLIIPYSYDCNDLDFHRIPGGWSSQNDFFDYMKSAFDVLYQEGLNGSPKMMTIGLHCRITGKAGRFAALKRFVEYIEGKPGVWVATRTQIAEHFREKFPYRKGHLA